MNKNGSLIFNIVIAVAVVVLYILHFSSTKLKPKSTDAASAVVAQPKDIKASKIVFVNADTLLTKYIAIQDLKKETEAKQNRLSAEYQTKGQALQRDYAELQQRAGQGLLTSDQAKVEESKLMKRKQELEALEHQLSELADEVQHKNSGSQAKINQYLKEYNKNGTYNYILSFSLNGGNVLLGADSLDVTNEILTGLNEQYKANAAAPKKQ